MEIERSFFFYIGKAFSLLMPYKLVAFIRRHLNEFISGWVKRSFKSCGSNFRAANPMYLLGARYITIGANFSCFANLRLEAFDYHNGHNYTPHIKIGDNVSMNYDCHIGCVNKIFIGNGVLLASKVFITDHFHGEIDLKNLEIPPSERKVHSKGPVIIEDNVWIGEGVAIMPNITIGKNSIIGANSVVTKSFPENSVIAGVPAKLIKLIDK